MNASQVLRFAGSLDADGKYAFREVYVEQQGQSGSGSSLRRRLRTDAHLYVPSQDTTSSVATTVRMRPRGRGRRCRTRSAPGRGHEASPARHVRPLRKARPARSARRAPCHLRTRWGSLRRGSGRGQRQALQGSSGAFQREYRHHASDHAGAPRVPGARRRAPGRQPRRKCCLCHRSRDRDGDALVESGAGGLRAPAGMAFGPDGMLYVSSRVTRQILRFDAGTGKPDATPFIDGAPGFPVHRVGRKVTG